MLVVAAWALALPLAKAQTALDSGSILRQELPVAIALPRAPLPPLQIDQPQRPPLQAPADARLLVRSLRITGQTAFPEDELLMQVRYLVGTEAGLAELEQAAALVSRYYHARGYVVARAYLPAQEIRDGSVEIAVLEGRIGRVVINNRSRVNDEAIASRMEGLQGKLVRDITIDPRVRLVYELAGIDPASQVSLESGTNVGESDLVLQVAPTPLVTGSLDLDNHGNRFTGSNRLSGQVNLNSPAGAGDVLSVRATAGDPGLGLYSLSYRLPVGATGLRLGTDFSHVDYRLGRDFAPLGANGTADIWLAFASYPLVLGRSYSAYAHISYQRVDLQDAVEATSTVTDKAGEIGTLALTGEWQDTFAGGGSTMASLSYGAGKLDIESPDARAIDDATARAHGSYRKLNLSLSRVQRVTERVSLYLMYAGQLANKNLDAWEKMSLGGSNGVKAYPPGEAPGDSGYLLSTELRYNLRRDWYSGQAQLLASFDTGEVRINRNQFMSGTNRRRLGAVGVGVNWTGKQGLQLRLLVAHKQGKALATADADQATRAWLQLRLVRQF
jgi:hemolysin activation/secretion protein